MALEFVGSITLADVVPGLSEPINALLQALATLRFALGNVAVALGIQLDLTATLESSLEVALLADLDVQIQASINAAANISLTMVDPTVYIETMLYGAATLALNVTAKIPDISAALSLDLAAQVGITAALSAKRAVLKLLVDAVAGLRSAIAGIVKTLNKALTESLSLEASITGNGNLQAQLSTGGLYAYHYSGQIGSAASEIAALVNSGLPGGLGPTENVRGLVVFAASPEAKGAMQFAFGVNLWPQITVTMCCAQATWIL